MKYLQLILAPFTWVAFLFIDIPLWLVGIPICYYLARTKKSHVAYVSRYDRTLRVWAPKWAWLWSNDEDGVDGLRGGDPDNFWWRDQTKDDWTRLFHWSGWRNPVGNLRFVPLLSFKIDPSRVHFIGNADPRNVVHLQDRPFMVGTFVWQFPYSGLWLYLGKFRFRIGWKLEPKDAQGLEENDYRRQGCGFTFQR
jgi:hypothetical protein